MRKYAILGSLLILGMALAGRAVSLAQKKSPVVAITNPDLPRYEEKTDSKDVVQVATLPNAPIVEEPTGSGFPVAIEPRVGSAPVQAQELAPLAVSEPPPVAPTAATPPEMPSTSSVVEPVPVTIAAQPAQPTPAPPTHDDPMNAVDSFLERNRKEADSSIQALNQEAEILRARLQKVEAALARWQDVSRALKAEGAALQARSTRPENPQATEKDQQLQPVPAQATPTPLTPTLGEEPPMAPSSPEPTRPQPAKAAKWSKPEPEPKPAPVAEVPLPSIPPTNGPEANPLPPGLPAPDPAPTLPPAGEIKLPEKSGEPVPELPSILPEPKIPPTPEPKAPAAPEAGPELPK